MEKKVGATKPQQAKKYNKELLKQEEKQVVEEFEAKQKAIVDGFDKETKGSSKDELVIYAAKKSKIALESYREFAIKHPNLAAYGLSVLNVVSQTVIAGPIGAAHALKSEGIGYAIGEVAGDKVAEAFGYAVDKGASALVEDVSGISYEDAAALVAVGAVIGVVGVSGAKVFSQLAKKFSFKDWGEFKNYAGSKFLSKVQKDVGLKENLLAREGIKQPKYSNDPFTEAMNCGRHSAWAKQYTDKSTKEVEKGIKSLERQIALHQDKIKNPEKYYPDFYKEDIRRQNANINRIWPQEIKTYKEQKKVLEGILKSKVN